jgi:acetyl-CoA carboxylase biotin carboxylase subunit
MFRRMLIANRGEIAVRLIRACHELGIEAVLAHSEADRESLGARLADRTVCIGPPANDKSYLNIPNVVSAALITECDSLHPGYGFLSENAYLAEVCGHCQITFVGPSAEMINAFSNKVSARRRMAEIGLPVVPGSDDVLPNLEAARAAAADVGYPVMLKAAAGGGGRGMRVAYTDEDVVRAFPVAQAEAQASFGNGDLYVEHLVHHAKHIEVQIAADLYGATIHLGDRDCSVQRRQQKLLEESPAPTLNEALHTEICSRAAAAARAIGYQNIGTMEFLVDAHGRFAFIEMNTRLQVEHPVTELVTGIDVAKLQIRLAAGEPLGLSQDDIRGRGHAIECRIIAEDPARDFAPEYSPILEYEPPGGPGVRIDSHLYAGYAPPPYYDSLLAKIITWGADRAEALARMERTLRETRIVGPKTTIPYHLALLADQEFRGGRAHTQYGLGRDEQDGEDGAHS